MFTNLILFSYVSFKTILSGSGQITLIVVETIYSFPAIFPTKVILLCPTAFAVTVTCIPLYVYPVSLPFTNQFPDSSSLNGSIFSTQGIVVWTPFKI